MDPSHAITVYADELEDEWPMFALHGRPAGSSWLMKLYDDETEYILSVGAAGEDATARVVCMVTMGEEPTTARRVRPSARSTTGSHANGSSSASSR